MNAKDWDFIADRYEQEITSPFQEGVINPIYDAIRAIPNKQGLTVADLGCGLGPLLPFLSKSFKQVVAIDFSSQMLEKAKKRIHADNVSFHNCSLTDLSPFYNQFDVAVSVNSVLFPSSQVVNGIFCNIRKALKVDGIFAGIFPSMEAILYEATLVFDRQIEKIGDEEKALLSAKRILKRRNFDFVSGVYDDHGHRQKFYYEFELRHRLKKAGFKNLHVKKVLYPWGEDMGSSQEFIHQPRVWDWFIEAHPRSDIASLN
jgi:SAM-dependent methyltransferase